MPGSSLYIATSPSGATAYWIEGYNDLQNAKLADVEGWFSDLTNSNLSNANLTNATCLALIVGTIDFICF